MGDPKDTVYPRTDPLNDVSRPDTFGDLHKDAYEDNNPVLLGLVFDGESVKLKLKIKKLPGVKETGIFAVKKKKGKYTINFGLGEEEYDEDDLPNPIKKLIDVGGGGPGGGEVVMPPMHVFVTETGKPKHYSAYHLSQRFLDALKGKSKPLDQRTFDAFARLYADLYRRKNDPKAEEDAADDASQSQDPNANALRPPGLPPIPGTITPLVPGGMGQTGPGMIQWNSGPPLLKPGTVQVNPLQPPLGPTGPNAPTLFPPKR
jgi:hypothetical protein